jgi:diamine N-acetyltransferase
VSPEDGTVWIARHMVGAPFQGKGYGRQGLRCTIDHLRQLHPASPIFLDVAPSSTAAISLYESEGFRDTGKTQGKSRIYRLNFG